MLNTNSFDIETVLFDHKLDINIHVYNVYIVEAYIDFFIIYGDYCRRWLRV